MILRTAEVATQSGAQRVVIATDDVEILSVVQSAGFEAFMTSPHHTSGTDRLAELAERLEAPDHQVLVNLQGDEPLMPPEVLRQVAQRLLSEPEASVATAVTAIHDPQELTSPHAVKAVINANGHALYFSRAPIPFAREHHAAGLTALPPSPFTALRHLGIYAFRAGPLRAFSGWGPCMLETTEQLEQLRWLFHGHLICTITLPTAPPPGIDTPEDLARAQALLL